MVNYMARRLFIQKLLALALLVPLSRSTLADRAGEQLLASAYRRTKDKQYGVAVCDRSGKILSRTLLQGRGHACVFHPNYRQMLVFARRPGRFITVVDLDSGNHAQQINSMAGRHFYGHGCFNQTGSLLYATENDYNTARGVIGIYDANRDYARVGEFSTHGIGPHDIALLADGSTLVVANGGIETHPESGAEKLNLLDMRSSLVFINVHTGKLLNKLELPDEFRRLSIRHLSVNSRGDCYFGGQYEGPPEDMPSLAGSLTRAGRLSLWPMPLTTIASLKNYVSSVSAIPGSSLVAISSSRGGVVVVWDDETKQIQQVIEAVDGSGIAANHTSLYLSSGDGTVRQFFRHSSAAGWRSETKLAGVQWDNHLALRI